MNNLKIASVMIVVNALLVAPVTHAMGPASPVPDSVPAGSPVYGSWQIAPYSNSEDGYTVTVSEQMILSPGAFTARAHCFDSLNHDVTIELTVHALYTRKQMQILGSAHKSNKQGSMTCNLAASKGTTTNYRVDGDVMILTAPDGSGAVSVDRIP